MKRLLYISVFMFLIMPIVSAELGGSIFGVIKDEKTGQIIPGADISIETGFSTLKFKSLPNGYYSVIVPAGRGYIITVNKSGYKEKKVGNVTVKPNDATEVNILLIRSFKPETLRTPMEISPGSRPKKIIRVK